MIFEYTESFRGYKQNESMSTLVHTLEKLGLRETIILKYTPYVVYVGGKLWLTTGGKLWLTTNEE